MNIQLPGAVVGFRGQKPIGKTRLARLFVCVAIGCAIWPNTNLHARQPDAQERARLLKIETSWNDAIRRQDVNFLDRLIVPDFELIASPGKVISKAELLRSVTDRKYRITTNGCRGQNVRVYGNTAVITGIYFETGIAGDKSYSVEARYTDIYVVRNRDWQAVSAHSSPSPPVFTDLQPGSSEKPR